MLPIRRNLLIQFGLAASLSFTTVRCASFAQPVRVPVTAAVWHRVDPGAGTKTNAEEFYLRTGPDCRAYDDCIQYAPVPHGFILWNIYPEDRWPRRFWRHRTMSSSW